MGQKRRFVSLSLFVRENVALFPRDAQVPHCLNFHFKPTVGLKPASVRDPPRRVCVSIFNCFFFFRFFRVAVVPVADNRGDSQVKYHLRALAIMGSEIPTFRSPGMLGVVKMRLIISIGNYVLTYAWQPNKRGSRSLRQDTTLFVVPLFCTARSLRLSPAQGGERERESPPARRPEPERQASCTGTNCTRSNPSSSPSKSPAKFQHSQEFRTSLFLSKSPNLAKRWRGQRIRRPDDKGSCVRPRLVRDSRV